MNKQTIQQVEARIRILILRLARDANELKMLDAKIKKMRTGKIKVPPPPGVKHGITTEHAWGTWATQPLPDDVIPDFRRR